MRCSGFKGLISCCDNISGYYSCELRCLKRERGDKTLRVFSEMEHKRLLHSSAHAKHNNVSRACEMEPTYPLAPVLNFISCFLILVSLLGIVTRPWNTGVLMLVVYVSLKSLVIGINTAVWSNNVKDVAPIWCDIGESNAFIQFGMFLIKNRQHPIFIYSQTFRYLPASLSSLVDCSTLFDSEAR